MSTRTIRSTRTTRVRSSRCSGRRDGPGFTGTKRMHPIHHQRSHRHPHPHPHPSINSQLHPTPSIIRPGTRRQKSFGHTRAATLPSNGSRLGGRERLVSPVSNVVLDDTSSPSSLKPKLPVSHLAPRANRGGDGSIQARDRVHWHWNG